VNWEDRNTCILFGDGAGACVIGRDGDVSGLLGAELASDGKLWNLLYMNGPQATNTELRQEEHSGCHIEMIGRDVFKHAVRAMEESIRSLLQRHAVDIGTVDLMIPHQANVRILTKLMERIEVAAEKVYINVHKYGNTSAASIPIALDEANRSGRLQDGDLVLLCSFGGGFTWGSLLLRW
jgi:3-oxoacyl-[acyl-carrier-protein] synthase-3